MRTLFIALMLFAAVAVCAEQRDDGTAGVYIGGEYRYDALEYSGDKRHFVRDSAGIDLSGKTSLDFSHMYIQDTDLHRYTWNFRSAGLIPYGELVAGHYFLSFGTGLLMGAGDGRESDPFSPKKIEAGREFYRPCLSGNPASAFYGGLVKYSWDISGCAFSCSPFFSHRERYVQWDYRDSGAGRYRTLAGHIDRKNCYWDPAYLTDAGLYCSAMLKYLFIQACFIYSGVADEHGRPINVSPSDGDPAAFRRYYGLGVFAQYRDDYLRIFAEVDVPIADREGASRAGKPGIVCGAQISHRCFEINVNALWCGSSYFSLHGSPSLAAGTSWQCGFTVKPARGVRTGFSCSAEKENRPGYGEKLPGKTRRERIYLGWKVKRKIDITLRCGRIIDDGDADEKKAQVRVGIKVRATPFMYCTVSGLYQYRRDRNSGCCPVKLNFMVRKIFRAAVYYSPFFIGEKNTIYVRVLPVKDAVSPGMFVRKNSHLAAVQAGASYRGLEISARYRIHFDTAGVLSHEAEARLGYLF